MKLISLLSFEANYVFGTGVPATQTKGIKTNVPVT
jgi:hypothetical protein